LDVTTLLASVESIDRQARELRLDDGSTIPYDTLVLATGARHAYFGHDSWEPFAPGLKTLEDATTIRGRILLAFEEAECERDEPKRAALLTFVIVGGGPTGVELAGALGEIANDTLKHDFRSIRPEEARIILLEGSDRVLRTFASELSASAERALIRIGVRPRPKVMVTDIDERGVNVKGPHGEERIDARTVIWAAGVRGSPFGKVLAARAGAQLEPGGQVLVEPDCSMAGHPEIFVIGDLASFQTDGHTLPGVAQVAIQQGKFVARVIEKRLRREEPPGRFRYFDKGAMAVIGRGAAVAEAGRLRFTGFVAWLAWLFIHLLYLVEFSNRLIVLLHWGYLYITFNRGARLITGSDKLLQESVVEQNEAAYKA
jgi:NADH dehydrogenase